MVNQHNEIFFLVFSFGILDVWLRVQSRWIGAYSIFELAPNLFTLLWAIILVAVVTIVPSRRAGRILYGILYYFFLTYTIIQYGAYLILEKFLYISDFLYAGEGGDYASWVISFITPSMVLWIIVLIIIGVCGIVFFPTKNHNEKKLPLFVWEQYVYVSLACFWLRNCMEKLLRKNTGMISLIPHLNINILPMLILIWNWPANINF